MSDSNKIELANKTFSTICLALDKENWPYQKDEQNLRIECKAQGDDMPIELIVRVDPEGMRVTVLSHIPFVIQEDKRLEMAIAISAVNSILVDGCFDYDVTSGHIFFRMTNSFFESELGAEVFNYMLYCSCQTIDDFNDKFLMIAKGMLSLEQFLTSMN